MAKLKYGFGLLLVLTMWNSAIAQSYPVKYITEDSSQIDKIGLIKTFPNRFDANSYLAGLLPLLQGKGFATASIDSIRIDSAEARIVLFLGEQYKWSAVRTLEKDAPLLEAIRFPGMKGGMNFSTLNLWQKRILDHLEENGRPFGKTYLDSVRVNGE